MNITRYGLQDTESGKFMGFSTIGNDGDFCVDVEYRLSPAYDGDPLWMVDSYETALIVSKTNTESFNAGYDSPQNNYVGRLKVVTFEIEVS